MKIKDLVEDVKKLKEEKKLLLKENASLKLQLQGEKSINYPRLTKKLEAVKDKYKKKKLGFVNLEGKVVDLEKKLSEVTFQVKELGEDKEHLNKTKGELEEKVEGLIKEAETDEVNKAELARKLQSLKEYLVKPEISMEDSVSEETWDALNKDLDFIKNACYDNVYQLGKKEGKINKLLEELKDEESRRSEIDFDLQRKVEELKKTTGNFTENENNIIKELNAVFKEFDTGEAEKLTLVQKMERSQKIISGLDKYSLEVSDNPTLGLIFSSLGVFANKYVSKKTKIDGLNQLITKTQEDVNNEKIKVRELTDTIKELRNQEKDDTELLNISQKREEIESREEELSEKVRNLREELNPIKIALKNSENIIEQLRKDKKDLENNAFGIQHDLVGGSWKGFYLWILKNVIVGGYTESFFFKQNWIELKDDRRNHWPKDVPEREMLGYLLRFFKEEKEVLDYDEKKKFIELVKFDFDRRVEGFFGNLLDEYRSTNVSVGVVKQRNWQSFYDWLIANVIDLGKTINNRDKVYVKDNQMDNYKLLSDRNYYIEKLVGALQKNLGIETKFNFMNIPMYVNNKIYNDEEKIGFFFDFSNLELEREADKLLDDWKKDTPIQTVNGITLTSQESDSLIFVNKIMAAVHSGEEGEIIKTYLGDLEKVSSDEENLPNIGKYISSYVNSIKNWQLKDKLEEAEVGKNKGEVEKLNKKIFDLRYSFNKEKGKMMQELTALRQSKPFVEKEKKLLTDLIDFLDYSTLPMDAISDYNKIELVGDNFSYIDSYRKWFNIASLSISSDMPNLGFLYDEFKVGNLNGVLRRCHGNLKVIFDLFSRLKKVEKGKLEPPVSLPTFTPEEWEKTLQQLTKFEEKARSQNLTIQGLEAELNILKENKNYEEEKIKELQKAKDVLEKGGAKGAEFQARLKMVNERLAESKEKESNLTKQLLGKDEELKKTKKSLKEKEDDLSKLKNEDASRIKAKMKFLEEKFDKELKAKEEIIGRLKKEMQESENVVVGIDNKLSGRSWGGFFGWVKENISVLKSVEIEKGYRESFGVWGSEGKWWTKEKKYKEKQTIWTVKDGGKYPFLARNAEEVGNQSVFHKFFYVWEEEVKTVGYDDDKSLHKMFVNELLPTSNETPSHWVSKSNVPVVVVDFGKYPQEALELEKMLTEYRQATQVGIIKKRSWEGFCDWIQANIVDFTTADIRESENRYPEIKRLKVLGDEFFIGIFFKSLMFSVGRGNFTSKVKLDDYQEGEEASIIDRWYNQCSFYFDKPTKSKILKELNEMVDDWKKETPLQIATSGEKLTVTEQGFITLVKSLMIDVVSNVKIGDSEIEKLNSLRGMNERFPNLFKYVEDSIVAIKNWNSNLDQLNKMPEFEKDILVKIREVIDAFENKNLHSEEKEDVPYESALKACSDKLQDLGEIWEEYRTPNLNEILPKNFVGNFLKKYKQLIEEKRELTLRLIGSDNNVVSLRKKVEEFREKYEEAVLLASVVNDDNERNFANEQGRELERVRGELENNIADLETTLSSKEEKIKNLERDKERLEREKAEEERKLEEQIEKNERRTEEDGSGIENLKDRIFLLEGKSWKSFSVWLFKNVLNVRYRLYSSDVVIDSIEYRNEELRTKYGSVDYSSLVKSLILSGEFSKLLEEEGFPKFVNRYFFDDFFTLTEKEGKYLIKGGSDEESKKTFNAWKKLFNDYSSLFPLESKEQSQILSDEEKQIIKKMKQAVAGLATFDPTKIVSLLDDLRKDKLFGHPNLSDVPSRIVRLGEEISQRIKNFESLKKSSQEVISGLKSEMQKNREAWNAERNGLNTQISGLNSQLSSARNEVKGLESKVGSLKSETKQLRSDKSNLESKIGEKEKQLVSKDNEIRRWSDGEWTSNFFAFEGAGVYAFDGWSGFDFDGGMLKATILDPMTMSWNLINVNQNLNHNNWVSFRISTRRMSFWRSRAITFDPWRSQGSSRRSVANFQVVGEASPNVVTRDT